MPHDPWERLGPDDARRVNSDGRFDFFWIVLESGMLGLMLRLSAVPQPVPRLPRLRNLVVSFRRAAKGWAFVLGLKERSQLEIFETLCRDVVDAGEAGLDLEDALSRAIRRTLRWHHLLRGGRLGGLSIEEQCGLVAELAFVRDLVAGFGPATAIKAWTGPAGSAKDFELIGSCVEVKAHRVASRPCVSISSEDQLADVDGSRLFLRVVNVASAVLPNGNCLHDHVRMTAQLFKDPGDVFDALENALDSVGYDPSHEYGDLRWQIGTATNFEILGSFPRISSPLPSGVENVRYAISLEACAPFELEADLMATIGEGLQA